MNRIIFILLASLSVAQPALAARSKNECGHFQIQISNLSEKTCVLTSVNVSHGNLTSTPPGAIMPNDSKMFYMEQTMIGPEVTLSYQCGNENIVFTSKQDLCFMEAGNVTGALVHPLPENIGASYTAIIGSYFWGKPGSINWRIIKNN